MKMSLLDVLGRFALCQRWVFQARNQQQEVKFSAKLWKD